MQITDATVMMAFHVRKKDTLIAFLLWWFLGLFGGHRFYCNRAGSGAAFAAIPPRPPKPPTFAGEAAAGA